jgi:hypothetical protein
MSSDHSQTILARWNLGSRIDHTTRRQRRLQGNAIGGTSELNGSYEESHSELVAKGKV